MNVTFIFKYNKNEDNNALLSAIICAALYPNVVNIFYPIIKAKKAKYPGFTIRCCEPLYPSNDGIPASDTERVSKHFELVSSKLI